MIDTDKEVKNILFDLGVEGNEYGDLVEYISNLLAEVERLREVAYSKDMQVGERNNEIKRLREGIKTYLENAKASCNAILKLGDLVK